LANLLLLKGTGENCGEISRILENFAEIYTFMDTVRVPPPEIARHIIINRISLSRK